MKQIFLKVYPNGKTSTNASVLNFERENKSGEIVIDYSEVDYLGWDKQLDLLFSDGSTAFVVGTGNTLTVPLLESYLKKGSMTVQPVAKRLVGGEYEKARWQVVALSVRESLNVLENDVTVTVSIAEQMQAEIDAFKDAELLRVQNEIDRESSEGIRESSEITRGQNESTRQSNENTRISNEQARVIAEPLRITAEQGRVTAEGVRVGAETGRVNAEGLRVSAEQGRASAESTRVTQETGRVNAENVRLSSETLRIENEIARNTFVEYSGSTAYQAGNKVSYLGSSYVAKSNTTGNLPTNTTYWLLIAQKGDNTTANDVTFTPTGNLSSTNVQTALAELDNEKASKLFATNLVTNGDFSNGTTGLASNGATLTIDATYPTAPLKVVSTSGYQGFTINIPSNSAGEKVYVTFIAMSTSKIQVATFNAGVAELVVSPSIPTRYSVLEKWGAAWFQKLGLSNVTAGTSYFGKFLGINLTKAFGAGNEPTKEQMDWIFAERDRLGLGYLNGTQELLPMVSLLNLINTKVSNKPIATYVLNANIEVQVTNIDVSTGIVTAPNHGLTNNMKCAFALNSDVSIGQRKALPILPLTGWKYIVNATTDTFQISGTIGGSASLFTLNPLIDYSKFHIEAISSPVTQIAISGFEQKKISVVYFAKSHMQGANIFSILPLNMTSIVVDFFEEGLGLRENQSIRTQIMDYGHSQLAMFGKVCLTVTDESLLVENELHRASLASSNDPTSNISMVTYKKSMWTNHPNAKIGSINGVKLDFAGHMMLNGTVMEVYGS